MNRALFRAMFKRQRKKTCSYALGLSLYNLLLIGVFPTLSQSSSITKLSQNLPKLARVFRLTSDYALSRFESFAASQCFGQVWVLVMGIYTISTANELIAQYVSEGGMAYLLSSPVGRREVFSTQAAVLISGLVLMVLLTELGIWAEAKLFALSLAQKAYFSLGVLAIALFLTVGSYSLFFSTLFNNEEYVILSAACLAFSGYALDIFSGLDDRFAWVKYLTIFGWFRPQEVLEGDTPAWQTVSLMTLSTAFLTLACYVFERKDLCL
ncbi:ABC transporter permease subunit [Desulfosporosinus sp. FKA]|uniref:ABC transporter permease subunit n=1 Tax=Desulfosporosinus sp. FKA TaxID=1969834 RepID=UPI001FA8417E|nr:ABC transporter permease subunit [Desulfosporosinus sp. FKA]